MSRMFPLAALLRGRRWALAILRALVTMLFAILFLYFVLSLIIAVMKLTGVLVDGRMYLDTDTPTYRGLFGFQAICLPVLFALAWARRTLKPAPTRFPAPSEIVD